MDKERAVLLFLEDNVKTNIKVDWIKDQIEYLRQKKKNEVRRKEGKASFMFWNGKSFKRKELIFLPLKFG